MIIISVDVIDAVVAVVAVVVVADEAVPRKILGRQEFQNLPIFESLTHWLKIVSKIQSANIVEFYDCVESDSTTYIIIEYLPYTFDRTISVKGKSGWANAYTAFYHFNPIARLSG